MMELYITGHFITPPKIIDKPACIAVVVSSVGIFITARPISNKLTFKRTVFIMITIKGSTMY